MAESTISLLKSLNYNFIVDEKSTTKEFAVIRTTFQNPDEVCSFVKEIQRATLTNFRIKLVKPNMKRKLFRKKWICKHSSYRKRPGSEKNAQCESFIDASIKNITKGTMRKDSFLKMEPPLTCLLRINLNHTHDTEYALRRLDVLPEIKKEFEEYFRSGMSVCEARRFHEDKLVAQLGHRNHDNSAVNPTDKQIYYIYKKWRHENNRPTCDPFMTLKGKPAHIYDINNPDWVPSLKMGYKKIKACRYGNSTEKFVSDDSGKSNQKYKGFRRKKLLLDGEIGSKTVSSPNETILPKSIPIEYFQGSDIFSTENSCTTDTHVVRWTSSNIIQDTDTKEGILNKENTDVNLRTEQSVSSVKEIFTYKYLLKNLQFIKRPNDFWSISPIPNAIICARWNENYTCVKKLVIGNTLTVRVFLMEKWEISLSELMNITCLDDISNLLEKVENYKIIQFQDLK